MHRLGWLAIAATAATAVGGVGIGVAELPAASAVNAHAVLVVGDVAAPTAADRAISARLAASYAVTMRDDNTVTPEDVGGAAFALVASSVDSTTLGTRLAQVDVPVWIAKTYLLDDYGMTGATGGVDYGNKSVSAVAITEPAHPLAAGRTGNVALHNGAAGVSWGHPTASATTVAAAEGDATIFTIAAGAELMGGQAAPGCRMSFPLLNPTRLSSDGWAMFDAAATWAAEGCSDVPPPASSVLLVVGDPNAMTGGDAAVVGRLQATGRTVVVVDDGAVTAADASGRAFTIIASSVNSATVADELSTVATPVWVAKPYLFDDYGLAGTRAGVDYGTKTSSTVTITTPDHPMAAEYTGTVVVQGSKQRVSWARPPTSAAVVATAGADPTIFTIAAGEILANGQPAAGCRLTFPLVHNAPRTFTAAGWALFDAAVTWAGAGCTASPPPSDGIQHVVFISVDGLNPQALGQLGPAGAPSFHLLISQGVSTLNARTTIEKTQTLPNHTSMATSRKVALPGGHGVSFNDDNGGTVHQAAGSYVVSVFDLVHDAGGSTVLLTGAKPKFNFLDRSWDAVNGAPDVTGVDNGRDKIDVYFGGAGNVVTADLLGRLASPAPPRFAFVHYAEPDTAGHTSPGGFMGPEYLAAVEAVDGFIGQVLDAVAADPDLAGRTVVVVTSDHGGIGFEHSNPLTPENYTVPFFAWGAGVAVGADLYALNSDRLDPGVAQPPYSAPIPPIRSGEAANLVAELLGLPAVPGAQFNSDLSLDLAAPS